MVHHPLLNKLVSWTQLRGNDAIRILIRGKNPSAHRLPTTYQYCNVLVLTELTPPIRRRKDIGSDSKY